MVEIRDNSVHFINKSFGLEKRVQELATANLKNYLSLVRQWFGLDLLQYNFFLMPLAFFSDANSIEAIQLNKLERRLLQHLDSEISKFKDSPADDINMAIQLDIKFKKVKSDSETQVVITKNDPDAISVTISEEDIREKYPWNYEHLTTHLQKKYVDFKINSKYYRIRKGLEDDDRYCKIRLLDPANLNSSQKKFYNPNIVKKFDEKYSKAN